MIFRDQIQELIRCMEQVPDSRTPYNQRHKFLDIILAVTAILCGMDTWNEIEDWAYPKKEWLETFLELSGGIPSHDTINRVFQMIDPDQFHEVFFGGPAQSRERSKGLYTLTARLSAAACVYRMPCLYASFSNTSLDS